ncbi:MAG: DNA gyrase subunit A [Clostridiaceae bacterium]|nr:DNA gyrase subunit A [Clostridiaceae bacterium]
MSDIRYENQTIINVDLEREMRKSFIDYAMSVIVARALPDVRDGLKPVHRRILYAMWEDNLTSDKPYRKSATTVGNVLGRYHPHGDASVYDAMVRMAQGFSLRYPLVDGHGNFGSVDGDPPAAYRYTEARMAKLSNEMMADIEKETVPFSPNFDDKLKEPDVLPSRFPNLLVNGSQGIAVGMATNIPPHNLREVIDATCCLIDHPEAGLEELCQYITGPDFPTGGVIMGRSGIRAAYATGRGKILVRARAEIEEWKDGRYKIVVTEIPYMVNKARLVESIADLHKDKRVDGITDLRDESDRTGMRVVVELRRDVNPQVILNQLYKYTQMQETFSVNMLALTGGQPRVMNLREMLSHYIAHQYSVVESRTRFDLRKARERAHILEGLAVACDNIDEVIRIIRTSYDNAKERLMERFSISEIQAQAILEMQLRRLQGLEREKIESELAALHVKITDYEDILATPARINTIIKEEMLEIRRKYGDDRRTEISHVENEIDIEDLIEDEACVFTMTSLGYIKRVPAAEYTVQGRGGTGKKGLTMRNEDEVDTIFTATAHENLLFFTSLGRIYRLKGYQIPESSKTAKGMNIVNLLPVTGDEKVTAVIPVREFVDDRYIFFTTRNGTVKRTALSALHTARKAGVRAITLEEGDALINVRLTEGNDHIFLVTKQGQGIRFDESEVRVMGRDAAGVRGIRLREGDEVIGAAREREGALLLTVTENGYGKLTDPAEYRDCHRGGMGVKAHDLTEKTGALVGVKCVSPTEDDILLISSDGKVIRTGADTIRVCGRSSQGVRLIRMDEGTAVISMARTPKGDGAEEGDAEEDGDDETTPTPAPSEETEQ